MLIINESRKTEKEKIMLHVSHYYVSELLIS